jgi:hypothetical protein
MTPFLDLRHIAIDPILAQHLPLGLARFYEALPVAREGDSVTVAMSHPENVTAISVLTQLFHAEIVPIRTDGAAVRAALQQLYAREPAQPHGLLAWLPASSQAAWAATLAASGLTTEEMPITWLDAEHIDADTLLAAAHGGNYQLTLCALPEATLSNVNVQASLLREIHAPLWLVPAQPIMPRHILIVLRGFASDEVAVTWGIRLAQQIEHATVALLPIMGQAPWGALSYLQQPGPAQNHIVDCALRLDAAGLSPTLTLQSGAPRQQVAQAMRQGAYDLMLVAAEGHGQFVGQLLADLEEKCTLPLGGVLVLKPSHENTQRLPYASL